MQPGDTLDESINLELGYLELLLENRPGVAPIVLNRLGELGREGQADLPRLMAEHRIQVRTAAEIRRRQVTFKAAAVAALIVTAPSMIATAPALANEAPVVAAQTQVAGLQLRVMDATSGKPLAGVRIQTVAEEIVGVTDKNGQAALPAHLAQESVLTLEREGYPIVLVQGDKLSNRSLVAMKHFSATPFALKPGATNKAPSSVAVANNLPPLPVFKYIETPLAPAVVAAAPPVVAVDTTSAAPHAEPAAPAVVAASPTATLPAAPVVTQRSAPVIHAEATTPRAVVAQRRSTQATLASRHARQPVLATRRPVEAPVLPPEAAPAAASELQVATAHAVAETVHTETALQTAPAAPVVVASVPDASTAALQPEAPAAPVVVASVPDATAAAPQADAHAAVPVAAPAEVPAVRAHKPVAVVSLPVNKARKSLVPAVIAAALAPVTEPVVDVVLVDQQAVPDVVAAHAAPAAAAPVSAAGSPDPMSAPAEPVAAPMDELPPQMIATADLPDAPAMMSHASEAAPTPTDRYSVASIVLPDAPRQPHSDAGPVEAPRMDEPTRPSGKGGRSLSYNVRPGDMLSSIAKRELGSASLWPILYAANRDQLTNPRWLPVGLALKIPRTDTAIAAAGGKTYVVQAGDSLSKIARAQLGNMKAWPQLYASNRLRIRNPWVIFPGQRLVLPTQVANGAPDHWASLPATALPNQG